MNSYFITGTDTDVGKTIVTTWLMLQARQKGFDAVPMKPVQTGCVEQEGKLIAPDLAFTLSAAQLEVSEEEQQRMCPYRFKPACSPHLAAQMEDIQIEPKIIMQHLHKLQQKHDLVLVEGAGGIFVPIYKQFMMLNLMQKMNIPVILAARAGLGTINHSLLSIQALRFAGLDIAGIVFIQTTPTNKLDIQEDNVITIEKLGSIPILGQIPYIPALESMTTASPHQNNEIIAALNALPPSTSDIFAKK